LHFNSWILNLWTHLTYGREFTNAVEAKQVAQQEAEKARLVEKVSHFYTSLFVFISVRARLVVVVVFIDIAHN
jgi:alanine racemase